MKYQISAYQFVELTLRIHALNLKPYENSWQEKIMARMLWEDLLEQNRKSYMVGFFDECRTFTQKLIELRRYTSEVNSLKSVDVPEETSLGRFAVVIYRPAIPGIELPRLSLEGSLKHFYKDGTWTSKYTCCPSFPLITFTNEKDWNN